MTGFAVWPHGIGLHCGEFAKLFEQESKKRRATAFALRQQKRITPKTGDERLVWSAVTLDAINAPFSAWEQWHTVDPHLFDAFGQMTHESINNLADLERVVQLHHYPIGDHGFLESVKGHLGEWQANADLSALHPVMADTSNFPGSDLWLDGHAANVKTVADVSTPLVQHFAAYPDIAAVVPIDAHHIPSDALYYNPGEQIDTSIFGHAHATVVDTHLSNAEMLAHTQHGFDAVANPAGGFHFPWITLAFTGYAEGRLLLRGETEIGRAAINTVGTAASVGGGAFAGKAVGATIGTIIAPGVGTIVGAVLGGFLGALGGKAAMNAVKREVLESALREFNSAQTNYEHKAGEVAVYVEDEWTSGQAEIRTRLSAALNACSSGVQARLADVEYAATSVNAMPKSAALAHISRAAALVRKRRARILLWSRFPGLRALFKKQLARTDDWDCQANALLQHWTGSAADVADLFDLAMAENTGRERAKAYLRAFFAAKIRLYAAANRVVEASIKEAVTARIDAVNRSKMLWNRIDREATSRMRTCRVDLREKAASLRKELRSAGAGNSEPVKLLDQLLSLPPPQ